MSGTLVLKHPALRKHAQKIATATGCSVVPRPCKNPTLVAHGLTKASRWHILTHEPPKRAVADLYIGTQAEAARVARLLANLVGQPLEVLDNRGSRPGLELKDHPRTLAAGNPSRSKKAQRSRAHKRATSSRKIRRSLSSYLHAGGSRARAVYYRAQQDARLARRRAANPGGRNARGQFTKGHRANPKGRKNPDVVMRVAYFPTNAAWAVIFGRTPASSSIIDIEGQRFWTKRADLVNELRIKGLSVSKSGIVTTTATNPGTRKHHPRKAVSRGRKRNPKGPLSAAERNRRIASLLGRAQSLFDGGRKAEAQRLYTEAWELSGAPERNPRGSLLAAAAKTFRTWQDRGPISIRTQKMRAPDPLPGVATELGELVSLTYRTDKYDGQVKDHEHEFSKPLARLVTDPEGQDLHIVRGRSKYEITADGIKH